VYLRKLTGTAWRDRDVDGLPESVFPHPANVDQHPPTGQKVGISSIGLFGNTPPLIVLAVDCCVGGLQRESRSSKLSHDQALSTSSRSSLLALKKGILFGGTSTRAPVFGLRPVRPPRWRVLKVPNPRISTLLPDRKARTILSKIVQTTMSDSFKGSPMTW
jgi:hypothetical protein